MLIRIYKSQPTAAAAARFYSFQALYTILAPYVSPFLSTIWLLHSGTLAAFTHRLGSTQNPALAPLAGTPPTAGTLMCLPV